MEYPRATPATLGLEYEPDPELDAILIQYAGRFVAVVPREDGVEGADCPFCREPLSGLGGTFRPTLVSGHGVCSTCGAECLQNHILLDDAGLPIAAITGFPLVYHPDYLLTGATS